MLSRSQSGYSLVELLVGLAVLAVLIALGVPEYSKFIANARLRNTAESISTGLNLARAEAVKRNARVEFVLTNEEPIEAVVNALPPATGGVNWVVREWLPATGSYGFIEGKQGAEGTGRTEGSSVVTVTSASTDAAYDGRVTFTGFGAQASSQTVTFQVTYPAAGACHSSATPTAIRCLNIQVIPGGQVRVCDPSITGPDAAKDTRACQ